MLSLLDATTKREYVVRDWEIGGSGALAFGSVVARAFG